MPTRELLSPAQRALFLSLPAEMSEQMLARYYTLSSEGLVRIRRHRRSHNKLGFAVQFAYLRFPGRTWTASEEASPLVVSYIANQLKVKPMGIVQYASEREATRFEHVETLKNKGVEVKEEYLQHLSPLGWEHINLTGDFQWNPKQLPPVGQLRPLRTKTT